MHIFDMRIALLLSADGLAGVSLYFFTARGGQLSCVSHDECHRRLVSMCLKTNTHSHSFVRISKSQKTYESSVSVNRAHLSRLWRECGEYHGGSLARRIAHNQIGSRFSLHLALFSHSHNTPFGLNIYAASFLYKSYSQQWHIDI